MAGVATREAAPLQVATPEWATHVRKYAVESIGAFFLTFVVAVSGTASIAPSNPPSSKLQPITDAMMVRGCGSKVSAAIFAWP